jgi:hypothetical protein
MDVHSGFMALSAHIRSGNHELVGLLGVKNQLSPLVADSHAGHEVLEEPMGRPSWISASTRRGARSKAASMHRQEEAVLPLPSSSPFFQSQFSVRSRALQVGRHRPPWLCWCVVVTASRLRGAKVRQRVNLCPSVGRGALPRGESCGRRRPRVIAKLCKYCLATVGTQ